MIALIRRTWAAWRFSRQLSRNLAARKALRPYRRDAALRGWEKRRAL